MSTTQQDGYRPSELSTLSRPTRTQLDLVADAFVAGFPEAVRPEAKRAVALIVNQLVDGLASATASMVGADAANARELADDGGLSWRDALAAEVAGVIGRLRDVVRGRTSARTHCASWPCRACCRPLRRGTAPALPCWSSSAPLRPPAPTPVDEVCPCRVARAAHPASDRPGGNRPSRRSPSTAGKTSSPWWRKTAPSRPTMRPSGRPPTSSWACSRPRAMTNWPPG